MRVLADANGWSRERWLAFREYRGPGTGYIGASSVGAILGLSPYSPLQTWLRITGRSHGDESVAAEIGKLLEDYILQLAMADGLVIHRDRRILQHESIDCLATNLDGVTSDGDPVEAKHGSAAHRRAWDALLAGDLTLVAGTIVGSYYAQLQTQLAVTERSRGFFAVLLDKQWYGVIPVERDDEFIRVIETVIPAWWKRYVVSDVAPPSTSRDVGVWPTLGCLESREIHDESEQTAALLDEYLAARDAERAATMRRKAALAQLERVLGDWGARTVFTDSHKIMMTRSGKTVDWNALSKDHPEIVRQYRTKTRPGHLRVYERREK